MTFDPSLYIRKAIVTDMKADPTIAGIVGARAYGLDTPATPTKPFTKVQPMTVTPRRAKCLDGSRVDFRISGLTTSADETTAANLGSAIRMLFDGRAMDLPGAPAPCKLTSLRFVSSQVIQDNGEAGQWHVIVAFTAKVSA